MTAVSSGGPCEGQGHSNLTLPQRGTVEVSANTSRVWEEYGKIDMVVSILYIVRVGKLRHTCLDLLECHSARSIP